MGDFCIRRIGLKFVTPSVSCQTLTSECISSETVRQFFDRNEWEELHHSRTHVPLGRFIPSLQVK